jgi:hypothetical protein
MCVQRTRVELYLVALRKHNRLGWPLSAARPQWPDVSPPILHAQLHEPKLEQTTTSIFVSATSSLDDSPEWAYALAYHSSRIARRRNLQNPLHWISVPPRPASAVGKRVVFIIAIA